ncbi:hypothetical protein Dimus_012694 [Dionaea muscipula]
MHRCIRSLITFSRQTIIPGKLKFNLQHSALNHLKSHLSSHLPPNTPEADLICSNHVNQHEFQPSHGDQGTWELQFPEDVENEDAHVDKEAFRVQNLLKRLAHSSDEELERALDECGLCLSEGLVLNVLKRHRPDWRQAFRFFNWVSRDTDDSGGYSPGSRAFNEVLDTLGRMKRFDELQQLFDEMSKREGVINERSFGIVVHRYAAAHMIEEATAMFQKRREYGFKLDLIAFQTLLLALCRYKHVEAAEFLFLSKKDEFRYDDIKTWNIILNGWSVLGNLREVKRFWNEIIRSKIKLDRFTYGIFINSLAKAGKISKAVQLFRAMWEKGCTPDVPICNTVIDGLCFKKRIPEALGIFGEMNDGDCQPDVATYNSLIKHLCNIGRMEKVYELLGEMEQKKGSCSPNHRTYGYLLKSVKNPEEVPRLLQRMEANGCKMTGDTYSSVLRLYMAWGCEEEEVQSVWSQMERDGMGPDRRSYTIMVHGLHKQGRVAEALKCFEEMIAKGFAPEPMTNLLVHAMKIKSKQREEAQHRRGGMNMIHSRMRNKFR